MLDTGHLYWFHVFVTTCYRVWWGQLYLPTISIDATRVLYTGLNIENTAHLFPTSDVSSGSLKHLADFLIIAYKLI